jgi:hypothetical protein
MTLRIIYGPKRDYSYWIDDNNEPYDFVITSGDYSGDNFE